ncbi:WD40 repeat domain-containing protein [Streptomyces mirabilis]|uniref:hypothetical protein n=1 Tax=Streptomyces mirabilis TaxID=68239 RepID=UPI0036BC0887
MGDEATRRLTAVLGTEASEVLRAAATSRNREVDLAEPRWTAAGYTGARLAAVGERSLPPAPRRPRTYVVKVSPADGRRREGARHHAALEMSPADVAARHLVSMEGDPIGLQGGGELLLQNIALLLQNIAGASLARCRPLSEFAPADRALTAAVVARALTRDWTEETTWHLDELTVFGFLRDGLAATSAAAGTDLADALGVDATLLDSGACWIETAEDGPHRPLVNPPALLDGSVVGRDDRVQFIAGLTHRDLHDADAHLIAVDEASAGCATLGDDGRIHLWSARSGRSVGALPIPGVLLERELTAPGRLAVLERPGRVLLAVADRRQVRVMDPATGDMRDLDVPAATPSGRPLSEVARNVISLAWVSTPGSDPVLVAGTQGGLLVRWSWSDDGAARALPPLAEELGMVTVVMPVPGGDGMRVLVGDTHGGLAVYDAVDGSLVHDLTRDDARVIGAGVVAASPPAVVTGHSADDACGLKVWYPEAGGQSGAVAHRSRAHDACVGPPRVGQTADGRPFVVHAVEDGVELLRLERANAPRHGTGMGAAALHRQRRHRPGRRGVPRGRGGLSDDHHLLSAGRGGPAGVFAG